MSTTSDNIRKSFNEAQETLSNFIADTEAFAMIEQFVDLLVKTFQSTPRNKVYSAGNGGSHCDAMHFAEEWTGRYRDDRAPIPALAFSDPSHITCTSNDYGFEHIFERMVEAFGEKDDVFLAITTSGNSPNIILAAEAAKKKGMKVVGLLGKDGGKMKSLCDIPIVVHNFNTARIQEIHIKIIHTVIDIAERKLFPKLNP